MPLTYQPQPLKLGTPFGLQSDLTMHGEEAAGSTYYKGALLQDNDAGLITESTSPVDGSTVADRAFGIAYAAATGTTSADVAFGYIGQYTVLEGTLSNATAGTHTLAATDKFQTYPITKATHNWYLDAAAVSADGGIIIAFKDDVGTVNGRVYFIITAAARGPIHAASGAL